MAARLEVMARLCKLVMMAMLDLAGFEQAEARPP
jgi:hypothetical protein